MSWLGQAAAGAGRSAVRLVPAARRDWAEAVWAEAVFGSGTTALLVKSAWVRDWLYHGQHLTASAVYGRELYASQDVTGYFLLLIAFPFIGLMMGLTGAGIANVTGPRADAGELTALRGS